MSAVSGKKIIRSMSRVQDSVSTKSSTHKGTNKDMVDDTSHNILSTEEILVETPELQALECSSGTAYSGVSSDSRVSNGVSSHSGVTRKMMLSNSHLVPHVT